MKKNVKYVSPINYPQKSKHFTKVMHFLCTTFSRLELAAHDALRPHFEEVDVFLQEIFLHFRNSALEWCLVLKLADRLKIGVYTQPKSFGTRFLPHTKKALSALWNNYGIYDALPKPEWHQQKHQHGLTN